LKVLIDNGYLKSELCDKVKNKKIDPVSTTFTVITDTNGNFVCSECRDLETWSIVTTTEDCSDINIQPDGTP